MEKLTGIDISEFNGNIDFKRLKKEVDFVYIRATYGRFGIDKRFKEYTNECIKYEIPFGLYYYSYATTKELATDEVKFFLQMIKNYKDKITFPLMIDMEDSDGYKYNHGNPSKEILSDICVEACEKIIESGYSPIIYANADWFKNKLNEEKISKYMKWLAWWEANEDKIDSKKYQIWQYSSKGQLEAVSSKYVDLNYSFVDFVSLKEYMNNITKINFIKSKTFLDDLDIQFLTCYKWGQHLINKIYDGLHKEEKLDYKELTYEKQLKAVQKYYDLELKTMNYINFYVYSERMLQKLYKAITIENNIVKITD